MESNPSPAPITLTPYGRACTACARAKAKCVITPDSGAKCERCLRLDKDCQRSQTTRKRKTIDRKPPTKVDRLEEKLDGLVSLLRSNSQATPAGIEHGSPSVFPSLFQLTPDSLRSSEPGPEDPGKLCDVLAIHPDKDRVVPGSGLSLNVPVISPDTTYIATGTRSAIRHVPEASLYRGLEPSAEEAEEYLHLYKTYMTQCSPFIIIPASTSARQLRSERPFLWLCIMGVASKSSVHEKAIAREIRLAAGREILMEGKNNLDLLLGLLVYIAWGHYHVYDKPITTSLIQLAIGLAANLGLRKAPPKDQPSTMLEFDIHGCPRRPFTPSPRTLEERRAIVGLFLTSSVVSTYFQRTDSLRWTTYLDDCLRTLEECREFPTDALLVQIVRSQLIIERVAQTSWHDGTNDAHNVPKAPTHFYLKALQERISEFKQSIPSDLMRNDVLLLHLHNTETVVHEIALSKGSHLSNGPDFQRLDSLYACLDSVKSWFDIFLTIPPALLSIFEWPDWDKGLVRDTANLSNILDQLIAQMVQVKTAAGIDVGTTEDTDIFSVNARTLGLIKSWWDSRVAAETKKPDTNVSDETGSDVAVDFMNLDDAWLQDLLGTGAYGFEPYTQ